MSEKSAKFLDHYKWVNRLTQSQLCDRFKISRASLNTYLRGAPIHPKVKKRMVDLSKGDITLEDLE